MIYGIYNFPTKKTLPEEFKTFNEAGVTCDHNDQCIVVRGSTREDFRYLGKEWMCFHCIEPETCTYCNPIYKGAIVGTCLKCDESGKISTWHLDGECLKCKE